MWEEGKRSEEAAENPTETSGKRVALSSGATCDDEYLLKACASRQEKPAFCHKNGAATNPHIGHAGSIAPRSQPHVAGPPHLHSLAKANEFS
jgi:hypothetical protein